MLNFFGGTSKKKPVSNHRTAERRAEPRVDTSVEAEWRFKPVGKIATSWVKVVLNDLSRTGGSQIN